MLTLEQREREERQILFGSIGERGQEELHKKSVLIGGVGAIGCAAAMMLSRAGVGTIHLVDHDRVELSNL